MTNNDADELYDRPTVTQLIQIDRRCTDVRVHMDVWAQTDVLGHMGVYRCRRHMDIWQHTEVGEYMDV